MRDKRREERGGGEGGKEGRGEEGEEEKEGGGGEVNTPVLLVVQNETTSPHLPIPQPLDGGLGEAKCYTHKLCRLSLRDQL